MATQYADEVQSASQDIADAGSPVTFTRTVEVYDATTDTATPVVTTSTGSAIRVKPRFTDIMRFQAPGLAVVDPVTLLVAGSSMAFDPLPGDVFTWGVNDYSVRSVDITGPDGTTVMSRIVGSR